MNDLNTVNECVRIAMKLLTEMKSKMKPEIDELLKRIEGSDESRVICMISVMNFMKIELEYSLEQLYTCGLPAESVKHLRKSMGELSKEAKLKGAMK